MNPTDSEALEALHVLRAWLGLGASAPVLYTLEALPPDATSRDAFARIHRAKARSGVEGWTKCWERPRGHRGGVGGARRAADAVCTRSREADRSRRPPRREARQRRRRGARSRPRPSAPRCLEPLSCCRDTGLPVRRSPEEKGSIHRRADDVAAASLSRRHGLAHPSTHPNALFPAKHAGLFPTTPAGRCSDGRGGPTPSAAFESEDMPATELVDDLAETTMTALPANAGRINPRRARMAPRDEGADPTAPVRVRLLRGSYVGLGCPDIEDRLFEHDCGFGYTHDHPARVEIRERIDTDQNGGTKTVEIVDDGEVIQLWPVPDHEKKVADEMKSKDKRQTLSAKEALKRARAMVEGGDAVFA